MTSSLLVPSTFDDIIETLTYFDNSLTNRIKLDFLFGFSLKNGVTNTICIIISPKTSDNVLF